jgi:protein-L-isoaspartate(D-aspartate) O-methyltransferase
MKQKPSFPAKLDLSLGKGVVSKAGLMPASRSLAGAPSLAGSFAASGMRQTVLATQGLGLDSSAVRANMVKKLERQGIQDARVLAAMNATHRHHFVDTALANQAYEDTSLPIGWGQTISKPNVVARMIELLFQGKEAPLGRVLEIGTGCGYQAAVLSHLAQEVYSVERLRGLYEKAQNNVRQFRFKNVHLLFGDGMVGFAKGAPYTGIIAAAGGEAIPQAWIDQLAVGGRIVAPVATMGREAGRDAGNFGNMTNVTQSAAGEQSLVVIDKTSLGIKRTVLELVQFVPLKSGLG